MHLGAFAMFVGDVILLVTWQIVFSPRAIETLREVSLDTVTSYHRCHRHYNLAFQVAKYWMEGKTVRGGWRSLQTFCSYLFSKI